MYIILLAIFWGSNAWSNIEMSAHRTDIPPSYSPPQVQNPRKLNEVAPRGEEPRSSASTRERSTPEPDGRPPMREERTSREGEFYPESALRTDIPPTYAPSTVQGERKLEQTKPAEEQGGSLVPLPRDFSRETE